MFLLRTSTSTPTQNQSAFMAKSNHYRKNKTYSREHENKSGNRWHKTSTNSTVCQIYDIKGHMAKTCRKIGKAMAALEDVGKERNWILDSRMSSHMRLDLENLSDTQDYLATHYINIGNGLGLPISHIGIAKHQIC